MLAPGISSSKYVESVEDAKERQQLFRKIRYSSSKDLDWAMGKRQEVLEEELGGPLALCELIPKDPKARRGETKAWVFKAYNCISIEDCHPIEEDFLIEFGESKQAQEFWVAWQKARNGVEGVFQPDLNQLFCLPSRAPPPATVQKSNQCQWQGQASAGAPSPPQSNNTQQPTANNNNMAQANQAFAGVVGPSANLRQQPQVAQVPQHNQPQVAQVPQHGQPMMQQPGIPMQQPMMQPGMPMQPIMQQPGMQMQQPMMQPGMPMQPMMQQPMMQPGMPMMPMAQPMMRPY